MRGRRSFAVVAFTLLASAAQAQDDANGDLPLPVPSPAEGPQLPLPPGRDPRTVPFPGGYRLTPLSPSERVDVGGAAPLTLGQVITSVERAHPQIEAARQSVAAAEGELLAAEGGFDLSLSASGWMAPLGYYEWGRATATITQPTPLWGTTFYGGWRIGRSFGDPDSPGVPGYYRGYETLEGGELRAGVRVPLWQDGPIDPRRARLWSAQHGLDAEAHALEARLLALRLAAARAYWSWVAAGRRYRVAAELLDLAELRDDQIRTRASAGAIPPVEALENRRVIVGRRQALVSARRALEQSALALSLYVRDRSGRPQVPRAERVPVDPGLPRDTIESPPRAIRAAWERRPELARYRALARRQRVTVDLAENRFAPRIDVGVEASIDLGPGNDRQLAQLGEPALEAGVLVSFPLQFREARGGLDRARAERAARIAEAQWLRDQIAAHVRDALSAVEAAEEALALAREGAEVANAVADAERRRFELGATELFAVNQREQAAAEASTAVVDAETALHVAHAELRAATARGLE